MNGARDRRILLMRQQRSTYREIARSCGVSVERIRQILMKYKDTEKRKDDFQYISGELRKTNDIKRRWSSSYLLNALGFSARASNGMISYFHSRAVNRLSVEEILDFILPKEYSYELTPEKNIPVLRVRNIGIILFASLVNRLCDLELGKTFSLEVQQRKMNLMKYLRHHGLSHYIID